MASRTPFGGDLQIILGLERVSMKIEKDKIVSIEYLLRDANGNLLESTGEGQALAYPHGYSVILPALETALEGKSGGYELKTEISPEDGRGTWNEELVHEVPREQFSEVPDLKVGMILGTQNEEGKDTPVMVIDLDDEIVTIDTNHPLAGKRLFYEIKVIDVRDATSEEIAELERRQASAASAREQ
jgi:FKBP-type peptidyl-prolyl cis-trans isomerase SlyD